MRVFQSDRVGTQLGLAYGPSALTFLDAFPDEIDYIEIPFEQVRCMPEVLAVQERIPLVLHCASLSVAGTVAPTADTLTAVAEVARRIATPWIGEHLAFISAEPLDDGRRGGGAPTGLTYTVCPQLSEASVERVLGNLAAARERLGAVPMLLENSPQYFPIPGSTMAMSEFISAVFESCDAGLLLDLSHFLITAINTGVDPLDELDRIPLSRVVEIHISGVAVQSGTAWDDHATPAPAIVFEMLEKVLGKVRPRALTIEYNWSAAFPSALVRRDLRRARALLEAA